MYKVGHIVRVKFFEADREIVCTGLIQHKMADYLYPTSGIVYILIGVDNTDEVNNLCDKKCYFKDSEIIEKVGAFHQSYGSPIQKVKQDRPVTILISDDAAKALYRVLDEEIDHREDQSVRDMLQEVRDALWSSFWDDATQKGDS